MCWAESKQLHFKEKRNRSFRKEENSEEEESLLLNGGDAVRGALLGHCPSDTTPQVILFRVTPFKSAPPSPLL